jgi:hypothetical protein
MSLPFRKEIPMFEGLFSFCHDAYNRARRRLSLHRAQLLHGRAGTLRL